MNEKKLRRGVRTIEPPDGPANFRDKEWSRRWNESQDSYAYDQECPLCTRVNTVYTQDDNHPEYYSDVYVHCYGCKTKIKFQLPVN